MQGENRGFLGSRCRAEAMNAANRWTLLGGALALLLVVLFPPWQQFYQGHALIYQGEMGHPLIWKPPASVGEQSWIVHASPSECQVRIKLETLLRQCGSVLVMTIVMFLAFRFSGGNERLVPSLTNRKVALVSLFLTLCLPLPQTEGVPLVALVVMAPISLFRDNGHIGPWALPLIAGTALAVCFIVMFLLTSFCRKTQNSPSNQAFGNFFQLFAFFP